MERIRGGGLNLKAYKNIRGIRLIRFWHSGDNGGLFVSRKEKKWGS